MQISLVCIADRSVQPEYLGGDYFFKKQMWLYQVFQTPHGGFILA